MSLDDSFALAKADISITVNGKILQRTVEMRTLLIDFLRDQAGLTGPRIGCDEGACGACTVSLDGKIIKSCLCLAIEADCCDVTTVESLGSRQNLARLQEAFRACHAVASGRGRRHARPRFDQSA